MPLSFFLHPFLKRLKSSGIILPLNIFNNSPLTHLFFGPAANFLALFSLLQVVGHRYK